MAKWVKELRWMRHVIARRDHEMRLDRWLRQQFPLAPQSLLQAQLRKRKIRLVAPPASSAGASSSAAIDTKRGHQVPDANANATTMVPGKANSVLLEGFTVKIDAHLFENTLQHAGTTKLQDDEREKTTPPRKKLPLLPELLKRIVYKDPNYLILDKPHGLAVQEGTGLESSLADYLSAIAEAFHGGRRSETLASGTSSTPRLVHRLDKETSGLLVLARNRLAAAKFAALLQEGKVRKTYQALVSVPSTRQQKQAFEAKLALFQGEITSPVDEKEATTLVKVLPSVHGSKTHEDPRGVWLELSPVTGRKHQLRVHCAQVLNAPIVGDTKYRGPRADRLYLHAQRIAFPDLFGLEKERNRQDLDQGPRRGPATKTMIDIQRAIDHAYPAKDAN